MVGPLFLSLAGLAWILLAVPATSQNSCPVFGNDRSTSVTRSREERIFLNFESPSQCRGNVTSYSYCFYDSTPGDDEDEFTYEALLMVYRRSSPTSDIYTPVPGSIVTLSQSHRVANTYRCLREQVQRFEIQENDVVGACVKDIGSVSPLYLIGDTNDNSNTFKLYQADTRGFDDCTNTQIQSVDTGHEDFIQRNEFILHVYANIDASASCRVGSNPPATAHRTSNVEGTYLNTDNPVACATENTITSWHYCYYTSPLTAGQTYTMTVAVWRQDKNSGNYRLIAGSARTISLVHVATLAKIFCLEEILGSAESVFVNGGDAIGVVLPSSNPIPVVSSDSSSSSSLMRHPNTARPSDLPISGFASISGTNLHLYGSLQFIPTQAPTTTEQPTSPPTTTEEPTSPTIPPTTPTTPAPTTMATTPEPTIMTTTPTTPAPTTMTTLNPTTQQPTTMVSTEMPTTMISTEEQPTMITKQGTTLPPTKPPPPPTTPMPTTEVPTTPMASTEAPTTRTEEPTPEVTSPVVTTSSMRITTTDNQLPENRLPTTPKIEDTKTPTRPLVTETSATKDSTAEIGQRENTGFSTGDIAAIILALIVVTAVLVALALVILVYRQRKKKSSIPPGVGNVIYHVANPHIEFDNLYDEINIYDIIPAEYDTPPKRDMSNYHELEKATEDHYNVPMNSYHYYQRCLEEVKLGIKPPTKKVHYSSPADNETGLYDDLRKYQIPTIPGSSIEIGENIGSGQFGTVHKGHWMVSKASSIEVAIKILQKSISMTERVKFLQEGAKMAQFKHPNVVTLHGITEKDGQRMLVVEFLSKGDLQNYLKTTLKPDPGQLVNPSTSHMLLEFSQQIALGMTYLSEIGCVHRDLAARNILISDSNICKITDFGMSRELEDSHYYISSGGKVPFKWTAPEALRYRKYSTASDVWSYGCLLYEIWSLGTKPFDGMGNIEVLRKLEGGDRLPPPPGCPKRVYELMIQSWASTPEDRPGFRDMLLSLLENKSVVLRVPPEDASSHPQAAVLGGPLEAGHGMYTNLQNIYKLSKTYI